MNLSEIGTPPGTRSRLLKELEERYGIIETEEGLMILDGGSRRLLIARFSVEGLGTDETGRVLGMVLSRNVGKNKQFRLVPTPALRSPKETALILEDMGLKAPIDPADLKAIANYIHHMADVCRVIAPQREGLHWYKGSGSEQHPIVVMGSKVLGVGPLKVVPCLRGPSVYSCHGDLQSWKSDFAIIGKGNPLVVYVLCFGLSAIVSSVFRLPRAGVLLCGASSSGKTTLAQMVLSLFGPPNDPHQWSGTNNGLEALAAAHPDLPLVIDELGSRGHEGILATIYRLTNGNSRARATATGGLQEVEKLRSAIFATGELSIWQQATNFGEVVRAGHEVRLPSIPVSESFGVYTHTGPDPGGAAFSSRVKTAINANYGVVYDEFTVLLLEKLSSIREQIKGRASRLEMQVAQPARPGDLSDLERRVLKQFCTVATAGILASHFEIFPFSQSEVRDSVSHVFGTWLRMWRSRQQEPKVAPLLIVKQWLKLKSSGHIVPLESWASHTRKDIVGYMKEIKGVKFFLLHKEFFEKDLCRAHGTKATIDALKQSGYLSHNANTNLRAVRMPGTRNEHHIQRMYFYAVRTDIIFDEFSTPSPGF